MSTFNFAQSVPAKPSITFFLNLAKYQDERETVIGFSTNGMFICSPKNDSAWLQFAAYSDKHGWSPMEATSPDGQKVKLNPEKFWMALFGCEEAEELPDVQMKLNLGTVKETEELYAQGGCLAITINAEDFSILGEKEYNGKSKLYLQLKPTKLELLPYYGLKIPTNAIINALGSAIAEKDSNPLAKYKRTAKKQAKRIEAELAKATAPTVEEDALMDL